MAPKIAENINKAMGYEEIKESDALDSHSSLQVIMPDMFDYNKFLNT